MLLSHLFHNHIRSQELNIPADRQLWPKEWKTVQYKQYKRFPEIPLPAPELPSVTLQQSLESRRSERVLREEKFTLSSLATILHFAFGINATAEDTATRPAQRRHYPSAGARYPIEAYLFIRNVETVETGIYHYDVLNHSIRRLADETRYHALIPLLRSPNTLSNITLLLTTKQSRNAVKYQDHGYDMLAIECGHACQNALLVCSALEKQACPFFGCKVTELSQQLDLDDDELIFYSLLIN